MSGAAPMAQSPGVGSTTPTGERSGIPRVQSHDGMNSGLTQNSPEVSSQNAFSGLPARRVHSLQNLTLLDEGNSDNKSDISGKHERSTGGGLSVNHGNVEFGKLPIKEDSKRKYSGGGKSSPPVKENKNLILSATTGMRDVLGAFWTWICGLLFARITIEEERLQQLKEAAEEGTVVYVVRSKSVLFYLLLNYLFLKYHLPLSRFAHGMLWSPFAPIKAQARALGRLIRPLLPVSLLNIDVGRADVRQEDLMKEMTLAGSSTLLFLKKPETWWGKILRTVLASIRDTLLALIGRQPPAQHGDPIEDLVRIQRKVSKPIFFAPQIIVWDRAPTRKHKTMVFKVWEKTFGERETPGFLRELFLFFRDRRHTEVHGGPPLNLKKLIEQLGAEKSDAVLAQLIRKRLESQLDREVRVVTGPVLRPIEEMKKLILESSAVKKAIKKAAEDENVLTEVVRARGKKMLDNMCTDYKISVVRIMGVFMRWLFQHLFEGIFVDEAGLRKVREANLKTPIVLIPCHKSHADYLLLSYVFFHYDMSPPFVAAGDNLSIPLVGWVFSRSGAFFIRRTFGTDGLYRTIFTEYVQCILAHGHSLEFFIEGGRSRNGKLCRPKLGMLSIVSDAVLSGRIDDVHVIPTHIGYDRIIEGKSYSKELMGKPKEKESLQALWNARKILNFNFGNVVVTFGEPISVAKFIQKNRANAKALEDMSKYIVRSLAHSVVYSINEQTVAMPTALVSTVILTNPGRGISRSDIIARVDWLKRQILARNGIVAPWNSTEEVVDRTLDHLKSIIKRPNSSRTLEPLVRPRESRRLELAYYRNQIIHLFISEGVVALTLSAATRSVPDVSKKVLLEEGRYLSQLLKMEFTYNPAGLAENFEQTIERMSMAGTLRVEVGEDGEQYISIAPAGEASVLFLCQLLYPFVDSYWIAALALLSLRNNGSEETQLLQRMQMIAETLYHEGRLFYIEAASMETLKNALVLFEDMKMVTRTELPQTEKRVKRKVQLTAFANAQGDQADSNLTALIEGIGKYRNAPRVADYPDADDDGTFMGQVGGGVDLVQISSPETPLRKRSTGMKNQSEEWGSDPLELGRNFRQSGPLKSIREA